MPAVREALPDDAPACAAIVAELPDYFTDDVPEKVGTDVRNRRGWVVTDSDEVVGFAVVDRRSERVAEILWIAVGPARRGEGIGTMLLAHLIRELHGEGVRLIETKTLDRAAQYPPYDDTRAFWEKRGFVHLDTIDPLPGWEPGNPAAIYVAAIGSTS